MEYSKVNLKYSPNKFFSFSCFELPMTSAWAYHGLVYYFETVIRALLGVVFAKAFTAICFSVMNFESGIYILMEKIS